TRGEHLSELHVGGSELDQPLAEGGRLVRRRRAVALDVVGLGSDAAKPLLSREGGEAGAREEADGGREVGEVLGLEQHRPGAKQGTCRAGTAAGSPGNGYLGERLRAAGCGLRTVRATMRSTTSRTIPNSKRV